MWFQSAVVVSCVALEVVSSGAVQNRNDEVLFESRQEAEGFKFPVLPRREQPYQNSIRLPETLQTPSESTTFSTAGVATLADSPATFTIKGSDAPFVPTTGPSSSPYGPESPLSTMNSAVETSLGVSDNERSTSIHIHSEAGPVASSVRTSSNTDQHVKLSSALESNIIFASVFPQNASFTSVSLSTSQGQVAEPTGIIVFTADIQRTTPTPSRQTQPIMSTAEHSSLLTISRYLGISPSRLNTVAENRTWTPDIPLFPNPTPIDIPISTLLASDTTTPARVNSVVLNGFLSSGIVPVSEPTTIHNQTSAFQSLTVVASPTAASMPFSRKSDNGFPPKRSSTSVNASSTVDNNLRTLLAEFGLSKSIAGSMTLSVSNASPISISPFNSNTRTPDNQTTLQTVSASATILPKGTVFSAKSMSTNTLAVQPTMTPGSNSTSPISSQRLPATTKGVFSCTNTSSHTTAELDQTSSGIGQPTGAFSNPSKIQTEGAYTMATPGLHNSTSRDFTFTHVTLSSVTSMSNATTPTGFVSSTILSNSATVLDAAGYGATKTLLTTPIPSNTATETVAASPPPLLTTSQTAGVAVGSTAGVLLAVVAAIFIARRYHANRAARRLSTGSVYPKVAYLYDPHERGNGSGGGDDDSTSALMSGGAGGVLSRGSTLRVPENTRDSRQLFSNSAVNRYSDPGNPFRDPEDPARNVRNSIRDSLPTPTDAAAAFSAAITGYALASQWSPETPEFSDTQTFCDPVLPSPALSPFDASGQLRRSHAGSTNRKSANSKHAYMSINAYTTPNSAPAESPSLEHDLLLLVSSRTETPDSVMVYATPLTPKSVRQTSPTKLPPISPSPNSPLSPLTPSTTSYPERFSLAYDSQFATTYIRPASSDRTLTKTAPYVSPISPPSAPIYKGWDEIKRYSNESSSPSALVTPPPLIQT